jgi:CBS domain-containing protein
MTFNTEWIKTGDSCAFAAKRMSERNIGTLLVKDDIGLLRGIITDRDLVLRVLAQRLSPQDITVETVMTAQNLALIYDDANLMSAERIMIDRGVRRLVVLRRFDNMVSGIISVDDMARSASMVRAGEVLRAAAATATDTSTPELPVKAAEGRVETPRMEESELGETFRVSRYQVSDVMNRAAEFAQETDSCRTAAVKMLQHNVGCLPVRGGADLGLVGILTDRDIVIRLMAKDLDADTTPVREVMTQNVACCYEGDNLSDAQKLMVERRVRRLPVLRVNTNEAVGMLSVDDIATMASRARAGSVLRASAQPGPDLA